MALELDLSTTKHRVNFGMTGYGKSSALERIGELHQEHSDWVVLDLWSGRRLEGAFSALPGRLPPWGGDKPDHKALDTTVLAPVTRRLPEKLPSNFKPFVIPVSKLTEQDLNNLLGSEVSRNQRNLFKGSVNYLDSTSSIVDLMQNFKKIPQRGYIEHSTGMYLKSPSRRQLAGLMWSFVDYLEERTIASARNKLALDLEEELNRDDYTVLATKWTPSFDFALFVVAYVLRRVFQLKMEGKIDKKVAVLVRELPDILPSSAWDTRKQNIKREIERILKQGRGYGISFLADAQRPSDISDLASSQFDFTLVTRVDSTKDIESLLSNRLKGKLTKEDLQNIGELSNHHFYAITPERIYRKKGRGIKATAPRHAHREEDEDFFEAWRKLGPGSFVDWSEELEEVREQLDNQISEYNRRFKEKMKEKEEKEKENERSKFKSIPVELVQQGEFKTKDVAEVLNISESQARKYVRNWRENGILSKERRGRGVIYSV